MQMTLPLSAYSASELQAKAEELLMMSKTARTEEHQGRAAGLAHRFARLAQSRVGDDVGHCAKTGSWTMLRPAGSAAANG